MRIYLGQLQRGTFVIRRRSASWSPPRHTHSISPTHLSFIDHFPAGCSTKHKFLFLSFAIFIWAPESSVTKIVLQNNRPEQVFFQIRLKLPAVGVLNLLYPKLLFLFVSSCSNTWKCFYLVHKCVFILIKCLICSSCLACSLRGSSPLGAVRKDLI